MRERKQGIFTTEWKDIVLNDTWNDSKQTITKELFEEHYGEFVASVYSSENDENPYCIWTKKYVVHPHKGYIESMWSFPREPENMMFG